MARKLSTPADRTPITRVLHLILKKINLPAAPWGVQQSKLELWQSSEKEQQETHGKSNHGKRRGRSIAESQVDNDNTPQLHSSKTARSTARAHAFQTHLQPNVCRRHRHLARLGRQAGRPNRCSLPALMPNDGFLSYKGRGILSRPPRTHSTESVMLDSFSLFSPQAATSHARTHFLCFQRPSPTQQVVPLETCRPKCLAHLCSGAAGMWWVHCINSRASSWWWKKRRSSHSIHNVRPRNVARLSLRACLQRPS